MNDAQVLTWLTTTANDALTLLKNGQTKVEVKMPKRKDVYITGRKQNGVITLVINCTNATLHALIRWAKRNKCTGEPLVNSNIMTVTF